MGPPLQGGLQEESCWGLFFILHDAFIACSDILFMAGDCFPVEDPDLLNKERRLLLVLLLNGRIEAFLVDLVIVLDSAGVSINFKN